MLNWIFLVRLIALVLSHNNGILDKLMPKSLNYCLIHKLCTRQLPAIMYSASTMDNATHACFLLCQDIKLDPNKWHVPPVFFLSILHPAKLESE